MATFNTYDYDFLVRCLGEGSIIFKSQALKRLNVLAGSDKKQFINHLRVILGQLQNNYKQDKQDINLLSIGLINEVVTNIVQKQLPNIIYEKHLPLIIPILGHHTKTTLRKAAHTLLLNAVKIFNNFNWLAGIYLTYGFKSDVDLVQQKSINSFQSILILEGKQYNWNDAKAAELVSELINKLQHPTPFVTKAASQCLLSISKMQGSKQLLFNMDRNAINKYKLFLQEILQKLPNDSFVLTPLQISNYLQGSLQMKNKSIEAKKQQRYKKQQSISVIRQQPIQNKQYEQEQIKESMTLKNNSNQRRLQKIKKSLKEETKQKQTVNHTKLFSFITGEGTLKQRTQAMQDLLYKVQVSKSKPQFDGSMKAIFPILLKMLKDSNPKIVSLTLRILQDCIQWIGSSQVQLISLISVIVQKLADQKISIRQNVSKVIRQLANKTDKALWIRELLQNIVKNTSPILKDQTLILIQQIYQNMSFSKPIDLNEREIIQQIASYTQDPKTKIKIRALDCLSLVAFHSKQIDSLRLFLKQRLSSIFYQMFEQKVQKLQQQKNKKIQQQKKNKKQPPERTTQLSYRPNRQRGSIDTIDAKSDGQNQQQPKLSAQNVRRRVSLLRKPRNVLSTQQTISLDHSYSKQTDRVIQQVQMILPSLYKKTNKFQSTRRGQFNSLNKTIQQKSSGDYLSKDQLKPLRDPQKQIKLIASELKHNDWKVQFQATNKLRRLVQFHPQIIAEATSATIHSLIVDLVSQAQNLRSSVAKNGLICIYQFVALLGKQVDPQLDILVQRLLRRSADTNAFISNQVQKCLHTVATNATTSKFLQKIAAYRQNKAAPLREAIVTTLQHLVQHDKIREKQYAKLAESLSFHLADGQAQIRNKAKTGLLMLTKSLGDWYRALRGKINPLYFKSICQLMTKSSKMTQTIPSQSRTIKHNDVQEEKSEIGSIQTLKNQSSPRRKPSKLSNYPPQFAEISSILQSNNSSDWKKRIEAIDKVKQIALDNAEAFIQFRSASHFVDVICKQIIQPNIKVSLHGMTILCQIIQPLKPILQSNLGIVCNSIFTVIGSSKIQIREEGEKCLSQIMNAIQLQYLMQFLCHGILYALPRARLYLLQKLLHMLEQIYNEKKQLLHKNVFPLLNKLMDQYKAQIIPCLVQVFQQLYRLMGNQMFTHLTKFKEVRQLIEK